MSLKRSGKRRNEGKFREINQEGGHSRQGEWEV
jgi:hypothetical protein